MLTPDTTVITWNMGSGIGDYFKSCAYTHNLKERLPEDLSQKYRSQYSAVQQLAGDVLLNSSADIYCLQEVYQNEPSIRKETKSGERYLIEELKKRDYEISRYSPNSDNVIAVKKSRFDSITNLSFPIEHPSVKRGDVAIVRCVDKNKCRMSFVSAHIPGFDLEQDPIPKDASIGDDVCKSIVNKLVGHADDHFQFIGIDINALFEKHRTRFQIFENKSFQLFRTQKPTNVNPSQNLKDRELDYLFGKVIGKQENTSMCLRINSNPSVLLDFDVSKNSSDHLPVFSSFITSIK